MYLIKDWDKTFENADTRKRMRLGWFLCPSGTDSAGYIELMSHGEAGIKAYAVFLAICQWSATCVPDVRGRVARSSGKPASIRQIAAAIRMPEAVVSQAFELLCSPDVGWIIQEGDTENRAIPLENAKPAGYLPVVCQSSAGCVPQGEGKGEGKGEELMSADRGRSYSEDFESFWQSFPKTRRTKKGEAYRKWKLAVKTVPATMLITRAKQYAQSERGRSEYAVMPSVWLNGRMWEDEPEAWLMNAAGGGQAYIPPSERKRDAKLDFELQRTRLVKKARSENWSEERLRAAIDNIRQHEATA